MQYLTPKDAAKVLGMSRASVYNCIAKGAPVHYWGPTGTSYRVDPDEIISWMDQQGRKVASPIPDNVTPISTAQMEQRRHDMIEAIKRRA